MNHTSKRELLAAIRPRYTLGNRSQKTRVLDEFVATTGYHRKYAIELLNHPPPKQRGRKGRTGRIKYTGEVSAALEKLWYAANCICSKRLVPGLPMLIEALERHQEVKLDTETKALLLALSPATADRLLGRVRRGHKRHGLTSTKPGTLLKQSIPIRTFGQWDDAQAGFMEIDLVAHCGDTMGGEFLYSLDMVDVKTRWVELAALRNRSQAAVLAAIVTCASRLPYPLRGLDSDNGSEFINHGLKHYCEQNRITFTRCRPFRKNDQAHVEQKNWTAVRQTVGYDRYEGQTAFEALTALYQPLRLYLNFFQPVMVLIDKQRQGAKVNKHFDQAKTPYQRVLDSAQVSAEAKEQLQQLYLTLNPLALLRQVEAAQEQLWKLAVLPTTTPPMS